jgi:peptidyl-prolyl cis-trans isomerase C
MNRKIWLFAFVAVALAALSAGCGGKQSDLVAVVGDHSITLSEFETGFASRPQTFASYEAEFEGRRTFLADMIDQKLLVIGAYKQGLDESGEIQRLIEQQQGKFLLDQLYKQEIANQVEVSEADLQNWYENMGEEIHARHILVASLEDAQAVRTELDGGADFAALAMERSKDPSAAQNAGDLSWFRWGTMVPAFQEVAFGLSENEISEPVQTDFGFHVIQLLGRRQVDRQPFDQAKATIEQTIRQQKTQIRLREFLVAVREKAELRLDMDMLAIIQETFRDTTGPLEFLSNLDPNVMNLKLQVRPLVRYLDTALLAGDFVRQANSVPPVNRPSFYDTTATKEFIFQMIYTQILEREARLLRIDLSEEYQLQLRQFREQLMSDKMRNDLLQRPVDVTGEMLRAYYDEHPEEFSTPPQVRVREALVETQEEANQIIERVRRGAKFADICGQVTQRPGLRVRQGDLGIFRRFEHPNLFDAAQRLEVGQVGGPVYHATQTGAQWSVIEVIHRADAEIKTFEEVEDRILNKLRNEMRQEAMEGWLAEMRNDTKIQINEESLAATIDASQYPEKG